MGSKRGGIDTALKELEEEVFAFLSYHAHLNEGDQTTRDLLRAEPEPPQPEHYTLLRKLQSYAGKNGTIPFLESGGYLDQPYLTSLALEACIAAEHHFDVMLKVQNARQSDE